MIDEAKIGELIGTVAALTNAFTGMQVAQEKNRGEFLDLFKEIRDNSKELATAMTQHIKDDNAIHTQVLSLAEWRHGNGNEGADKRISMIWDERNKQNGMLSASRLIGGSIWAVLAIIIGYFLQAHFK